MLHLKNLLLTTCVLTILASCSLPDNYFIEVPECNTGEESFQQASEKVKMQLLSKSEPADYRYFFQEFKEEGDDVLMRLNFRNSIHCFDMWLLVNKWDKLQGMYDHKGEGYPKELFNLTWEVKALDGKEQLRYVDMHEIID